MPSHMTALLIWARLGITQMPPANSAGSQNANPLALAVEQGEHILSAYSSAKIQLTTSAADVVTRALFIRNYPVTWLASIIAAGSLKSMGLSWCTQATATEFV